MKPVLTFLLTVLLIATAHSQPLQPSAADIEYAEVDGHSLKMDLYLPESEGNAPLIVWVHGGAWRRGDKASMPLGSLIQEGGYVVASVNYRLSPVARFPAQVHDIKAAIRFLRAHQ